MFRRLTRMGCQVGDVMMGFFERGVRLPPEPCSLRCLKAITVYLLGKDGAWEGKGQGCQNERGHSTVGPGESHLATPSWTVQFRPRTTGLHDTAWRKQHLVAQREDRRE